MGRRRREDPERPLHRRHEIGRRRLQQPAIAQLRDQAIRLGQAEEQVDLRDLRHEFVLVALDQAPHGDHRPRPTLLLHANGLEDRLDRLLLGHLDEAARVDDDDVRPVRIVRDPSTGADQPAEDPLAVDRVLVTAERDQPDTQPRHTGRGRRCGSAREHGQFSTNPLVDPIHSCRATRGNLRPPQYTGPARWVQRNVIVPAHRGGANATGRTNRDDATPRAEPTQRRRPGTNAPGPLSFSPFRRCAPLRAARIGRGSPEPPRRPPALPARRTA